MSIYYCDGCQDMRDEDRHGFNDDYGDTLCDECHATETEARWERALIAHYGGDNPGFYPDEIQAIQSKAQELKR